MLRLPRVFRSHRNKSKHAVSRPHFPERIAFMRILVTGVAGFIGFHVSLRLLARGDTVIGIDNVNNYYDVHLKEARLAILADQERFQFHQIDLADRSKMEELFTHEKPERVVHLAAQAGVRYSLINPHAYTDSNLVGFLHI